MIPSWRKSNLAETEEELTRNVEIKKRLINELSITVKELQKAYMEGDFEIDRNDEHALMLCTLLEAALLHGYQEHGIKFSNFYNLLGKVTSESMPTHSFWDFLVHFTHKDIRQELVHLAHITTPIGQCRAWVRLALNDCLIESYLDAMLSDPSKLQMYYKPYAFLMEEEIPYIMISFLQGLTEFKFCLNYNTPSLNTWTGDTLALAGIWQLPKLASHPPQQTPLASSYSPSSHVPVHKPLDQVGQIMSRPDQTGELSRSVEENRDQIGNANIAEREALISDPQTEYLDTDVDKEEKPLECEQSAETNKDQILKPGSVARLTAASPVPMMGSNKLGVSTGWSSAFDIEAAGYSNKGAEASEESTSLQHTPILKEVLLSHLPSNIPSYTHLLSDYTVEGKANFDTPVYDEEDGSPKTKKKIAIQKKLPSPEVDPHMPGFEVVPRSSSVHSEHTDDRTQFLMSIVTRISNEKGLDSQNYQCNGCGRNIGMIYGEAKVCNYDACYYCYECHIDEEHVIPARIIYNWDLRKHNVCRSTKLFLLQIEEEPLLNIDETNPSLYTVIDELQEIKMLRSQLQHLKCFIFTCKEPIADEVRRRIWPREYLWDDIHQYSLLDLIQTNSGQLAHHLKKVISYCTKHVYKCKLCCQKGFICEVCNDPKIIYPFQVKTTTQCPKCKAVYHKPCISDRKCLKCIRRDKQKAATVTKSTTLEFNSPW